MNSIFILLKEICSHDTAMLEERGMCVIYWPALTVTVPAV